MIIVSYDISDDRLRNRFSKFLCKFGHRLQYSVFEIENSPRIIRNVKCEIENHFGKRFSMEDSVYIFSLSQKDEVIRFGYAKNEEKDLVIIK